ncbi:AraC family transcriptional regulator [Haliscomenobacter sp.]|uniref:AraC family transcriptional regulator n=1 Tax=Haliscomenobacter sp. TaxID=2717303 RepID=UPI003BAC3840
MEVFLEITPLKESDVFVVLDAVNNKFAYPLHNHAELELSLVSGISGTRTVGDSTQSYLENDLVFMGPYLYHKWDGAVAAQPKGKNYRVITIQFGADLFTAQLLKKEPYNKIRKLLQRCGRGIRFYGKTYEDAFLRMKELTTDKGMDSVLEFFKLLDVLSRSTEFEYLNSEGLAPATSKSDSRRIQVAYTYILENFSNHQMKVSDLAGLMNMSDSAFSHFFRKHAHHSFKQFLIDIRVRFACKLLLDSEETITEICFHSGFNNVTNFNRLFMKYRHCAPLQYRKLHEENPDFDWSGQVTENRFVPAGGTGGVDQL